MAPQGPMISRKSSENGLAIGWDFSQPEGAVRWRAAGLAWLLAVAALGAGAAARAQELPRAAPDPRVLLLTVESGRGVDEVAIDAVDEALDALPALARWARPASSCDPAPLDTLAGRSRCGASPECLQQVAARCQADYLVQGELQAQRPGGRGVEVVLRVIDGRRGRVVVEDRLAAAPGVVLERGLRRAVERIAQTGWLAGALEVHGPASGVGVLVDGHDVGVAPVLVDRLAAGIHTIALLSDGRVAYLGEVEVEPGTTAVVQASGRAAGRLAVSVARRDERATGEPPRAMLAPTAVARRSSGELPWGTQGADAAAARADGVGVVVFEDRDPRRAVLLGRGRLSPLYQRGGVGASLRLEFQ